jgi:hypothetical protein
MVAGVGISADDEWVGVRDDCHEVIDVPSLRGDMVTVAKRPTPIREESRRGRSVTGHDPFTGRAIS